MRLLKRENDLKPDSIRNTSILFIGNKETDLLQLAKERACSILGTSTADLICHPDYSYYGLGRNEKTMGVETAKEIIDHSCLTAAYEMKVIVIDHMDKMTVDAQNKLLKTVEEGNVIIIGLAYEDRILSTLKSRMQVIRICDKKRELSNELEDIFYQTRKRLLSNSCDNVKELLSILGLVREKDPQSFFSIHRESVPDLIDVIASAIIDRHIVNNKDYTSLLTNLCCEKSRCSDIRYSKEDFFLLIAEVIENI